MVDEKQRRSEIKEVCVDDWIEVCCGNTKKYFESLGYEAKNGKFKVHPWDLTKGSGVKINIKCPDCKEIRSCRFVDLFRAHDFKGLCGTCSSRKNGKASFKDLTGKKFHRLTVIKRVENKGGKSAYLCQCDCGNTCEIRGAALKDEKTKSCGCLNIELIIQRHRDKGHYIKADHTDIEIEEYLRENGNFYTSPEWKKVREQVLKRDNYKCKLSGGTKDLVVHHLFSRKEHPELSYDLGNLVTIDRSLHNTYHANTDEITDITFLAFVEKYESLSIKKAI